MAEGQTVVYIVLAILILAFVFFVVNTIRCYLNKPRYVDDDEYPEHEMTPSLDSKI